LHGCKLLVKKALRVNCPGLDLHREHLATATTALGPVALGLQPNGNAFRQGTDRLLSSGAAGAPHQL